MILSSKIITKALISLRRCAGWSAPLLFTNPGRQVLSRWGPYHNYAKDTRNSVSLHLSPYHSKYILYWKWWRSRSVGFLGSHLIRIHTDFYSAVNKCLWLEFCKFTIVIKTSKQVHFQTVKPLMKCRAVWSGLIEFTSMIKADWCAFNHMQ